MLKSACCSICLSINKRTINIYETDLRYVYEYLASFKVRDTECWMCYICHTRLKQCHRLQQMAVNTRGLIDDVFQNKVAIEFGAFGSVLELSTSRTKIKSITQASSCKQKSDVKIEFCSVDEFEQDATLESDDGVEDKTSIKPKVLEFDVEPRPPTYDQGPPTLGQDPPTQPVTEIYLESMGPSWGEQNIEIKQERVEDTTDEGRGDDSDGATTSSSVGSSRPRGKNAQYYRDYRARKRAEQEKEARTSEPTTADPPRKRKSAAEYQKEYRARKKANSVIQTSDTNVAKATQPARAKRKTPAEYQREYRARKKAQRESMKAAKSNDSSMDIAVENTSNIGYDNAKIKDERFSPIECKVEIEIEEVASYES